MLKNVAFTVTLKMEAENEQKANAIARSILGQRLEDAVEGEPESDGTELKGFEITHHPTESSADTETHKRSIQHAKKALRYYLNGAAPDNNLAVRDLLADLRHYCDANTIDFYAELEAANRHYTEEVAEARQSKAQGGRDL